MAEAEGLDPEDLVILTIDMEKIIGDPISYLLSQIEDDEGEAVLFHCYECEVDMVRIEDRNGEPAFQCPKCSDVAQFDFSILNQSFDTTTNTTKGECEKGAGRCPASPVKDVRGFDINHDRGERQ